MLPGSLRGLLGLVHQRMFQLPPCHLGKKSVLNLVVLLLLCSASYGQTVDFSGQRVTDEWASAEVVTARVTEGDDWAEFEWVSAGEFGGGLFYFRDSDGAESEFEFGSGWDDLTSSDAWQSWHGELFDSAASSSEGFGALYQDVQSGGSNLMDWMSSTDDFSWESLLSAFGLGSGSDLLVDIPAYVDAFLGVAAGLLAIALGAFLVFLVAKSVMGGLIRRVFVR